MRLLCINNKPIAGADNGTYMLSQIKEEQVYHGRQQPALAKDGSISMAWCIPSISMIQGYALERFIPLSDTPAEVIEETKPKHATA